MSEAPSTRSYPILTHNEPRGRRSVLEKYLREKNLDKSKDIQLLLITIIMCVNKIDVDKTKEVLKKYVAEKGLRNTSQRETILEAFLSAGKHITVDELFDNIKVKNPEIGYATVHRNLRLMCDCGIADEIKIGKGKTKYEPKLDHKHHDHLICLKCGEFTEVNDEKIERLQDRLARAKDFVPIRHKLEIYGFCAKCR